MKRLQLWLGIGLVALVVLGAVVSLFWTPFDPIQVVPEKKLLPPGWPHLLGTDVFGIDIVSQLLIGARMCLVVGRCGPRHRSPQTRSRVRGLRLS